jgi:hypothetical protein
MRLAQLEELQRRVQSIHGLVEQFATTKTNPDTYEMAIKRGFSQLKMHFMGAGMDGMSQLAGSMEIASKRGMSQLAKARILREGVGTMRFQVELEQRAVVTEDAAKKREAAEKAAEKDAQEK